MDKTYHIITFGCQMNEREILVDTYTFEEMFQAKENMYDE